MTKWWLVAVVAVAVVVVVCGVSVPGALTDLRLYRAGGASWLHGMALYTVDFPFWLPFTYPPVAAVLFGVLAVVPFAVAAFLLSVASLVALSLSTYWAVPNPLVPLLAVAAVALEPVRATLESGQVTLVLMAMVTCDCLLPRTRHPRGLLVGLAAAVALTPAVFVLFFLARRQYQPAVTAVVTFAVATGAGMLLAPGDSLHYWSTTILALDSQGALTRLALSAVVLTLAWRGARRAADPVVALLVVAAGGLVVSPVSYSPQWVWIAPALAYFSVRGRWQVLPVAFVFTVGHHAAVDGYLVIALSFLAWAAAGPRDVPQPGGTRDPVSVGGQR